MAARCNTLRATGAALFLLLASASYAQDARQSAGAAQSPAPTPVPTQSPAPAPAKSPAPAQPQAAPARADISVWIGVSLTEAYQLFGVPKSVRVVRGSEPWQDDVVFTYDNLELYFMKDRVWKVRSDSAFGFKRGASQDAVLASLGEPLHRLDSDFIYQLPGHAWPIRLRVGFDEAGQASDIYAYRADY